MNCDQARLLLHPYLDGQLDVVESHRIGEHLAECPACEESRARIQDLGRLLAKSDLRFYAPSALSHRVRSALAEVDRPARRAEPQHGRRLLTTLAVAAVVLLAVIAFGIGRSGWIGAPSDKLLASDVTEAHIRSLLANHLLDVPSSDQHTVKPWFIGKVDFAPPVVDLADQGFVLAGGLLDVLDLHPVAALIYRRKQHVINVFVWPTSQTSDSQITESTSRGYSLFHWTAAGRVCWVISDLNANDLRDFAATFQKRLEHATAG